jgi:hypothetical protein
MNQLYVIIVHNVDEWLSSLLFPQSNPSNFQPYDPDQPTQEITVPKSALKKVCIFIFVVSHVFPL